MPGDGLSLSPASRGRAALEQLFSSDEEAELCERGGTCRLSGWPRLSGSAPGDGPPRLHPAFPGEGHTATVHYPHTARVPTTLTLPPTVPSCLRRHAQEH